MVATLIPPQLIERTREQYHARLTAEGWTNEGKGRFVRASLFGQVQVCRVLVDLSSGAIHVVREDSSRPSFRFA